MESKTCACQDFKELRGASVNGYISAFLEADGDNKSRYVCKVCGTLWEKQKSEDVSKSALVKVSKS